MKTVILTVCLYALCIPLFLWSWLCEQPHAMKMAWLNTFASAGDHLRRRSIRMRSSRAAR